MLKEVFAKHFFVECCIFGKIFEYCASVQIAYYVSPAFLLAKICKIKQ